MKTFQLAVLLLLFGAPVFKALGIRTVTRLDTKKAHSTAYRSYKQ